MEKFELNINFKSEDITTLSEELIQEIEDFITNDVEFTIKEVIIVDDNNDKWHVQINKVVEKTIYLTIKEYQKETQISKKGKYSKQFYKQHNDLEIIKTIGLNNAKMIHANDLINEVYIPLKEFLKKNQQPFLKIELYIKDINDNYKLLRHKNLFSEYVDEISDFERFTYIYRSDNGILKISSTNDNKILEYDYLEADLLERKFAREFAKLIYHNKSGFKDNEIINFLKDQAIYLKVEQTIVANDKRVWDQVTIDEMKHNMLEKEQERLFKERKKSKVKYYKSKREVKRNYRHNLKHDLYVETKEII